ncbi:MAG: protein kinase, partial [Acidobacteriaceae bacterium]|nr:protein kinase [Acidobacteriaceae bacterium]
ASQRPLPLLQKLDIMAQTAEGLHHAHVHGTFHRDIKPANIMILADGTVKIMDFGIALLSQGTVARITRQGSLVGTFPYMAPEQFYGAASDALTDLFAYGVTCYKLLTGVHPFQAPEMASMMFNIVNKTPAPIRSLVPECPEALEDAVSKMMAKERDSRYQTLEDVKFDLEPIIDELGRERIGDLIQQARTLIESGEFEQAQPLVREALEIDPGNRTARELRDRVQRLTKDRAIRPQITALIGAGRQQIQAQHYEQAIRKFESALQLDKSNREIQELIQQARAAWEQQQRADRLVGEARQALSAGELTAAHKGINDALSAFPDHSQAKALLAEVREKIEAREREARLHEGLVRVRGLVLLRSFEPALNELNQLRSEYPESADVERLLTKVTAERDAQVRRERLEARANEVKKLIRDQEFAKASDLASRSLRDFPESNSIADLGSYAEDEERSQRRSALIAQVTAETSALMEAGEFDEAISRLRNALQEHPTASSLRERLQAVSSAKSERARKEALERTHAEAARLIANSAFAPALDCIAAFTAAYGEAAELDRVRRSAEEELEKQRRIAAIRKLLLDGHGLLDEGRPGTASQMLQQATIQYPDDSALTHLLGVARDQIREQQRNPEISNVISEAESLARSEKFDEALQLLDEALKKNPQETRLVHCKEGISAAKAAHEQKLIRTRITNQAKALRQG